MRSIPPVVCLLAVLTLPRAAWPAQAPLLEPGARVRLYAPSLGGRLTGTLVARESDTLVVRVDGEAEGLGLVVPADSVTRLDVSRGKRPMTLEGAGIGMLGGTLLGLIASPDWVDEDGDCAGVPRLRGVAASRHPRGRAGPAGRPAGRDRRIGGEDRHVDAGALGATGRGPDAGRRARAGGEDFLLGLELLARQGEARHDPRVIGGPEPRRRAVGGFVAHHGRMDAARRAAAHRRADAHGGHGEQSATAIVQGDGYGAPGSSRSPVLVGSSPMGRELRVRLQRDRHESVHAPGRPVVVRADQHDTGCGSPAQAAIANEYGPVSA